jgi:phosphatidylglycerophosphatase A
MRRFGDRLRYLAVTAGGLGLSPVAPGTVGTLGGVLLAVLIQVACPEPALAWVWLGSAALLFAFGCSTTAFVASTFPRPDPGPFVLDEVVGYLVAVGVYGLLRGTPDPVAHAAAFVLFRAFDVLKVQPARRLEELPGALGIMADDVVAGVYAGVALRLLLPLLGW